MATTPKSKPCDRYTASGDKCTKTTTSPDGWCHQCAGLTAPIVPPEAGAELDAATAALISSPPVIDLREPAATGDEPDPRDTPTMVGDLRSSIAALAEVRDIDAAGEVLDAVSANRDALLDRHPDLLGVALVEGSWDDPQTPEARRQVLTWLTDQFESTEPAWVERALRELAPHAPPEAVNVAVARFEHLRAPSATSLERLNTSIEAAGAVRGANDLEPAR